MRLTQENRAKLRETLLDGAAKALRRDGYEAANLDRIMAEAGLTRGAFYAHFASKEALLAQVLAERHPLKEMLARREGDGAATLLAGMKAVFDGYLAPENLAEVFHGCTIAALTDEAARRAAVRAGFQAGRQSVLAEMARGQAVRDGAALEAALTLATGAVTTARAMETPQAAAAVLRGARAALDALLDRALASG